MSGLCAVASGFVCLVTSSPIALISSFGYLEVTASLLMPNRDDETSPLIDDSTRTETHRRDVFILGAGFSKAIANQMPTMIELGAEVRRRLADVTSLSSAIPDSLGDNIELWMTYLSQPQPWLREPEIDLHRSLGGRIRQSIAAIIEERTKLASASPAPDWLRRLILAWHTREAVVITLNYDTLIEKAARDLQVSEKISALLPTDIYPPYFANIASRSGAGLWGHEVRRTLRLIKLHGSVNWYYSGREYFHGETIFYSDVPEFGPARDEAARCATRQRLNDMAADKEILLIPPVSEKTTYFNNETIRGLWKDAAAALQNAAALYIIGYSLPMSDLGMRFFLAGNDPSAPSLVQVVNTDTNILQRYGEILNRSDMRSDYIGPDNPIVRLACDYSDKRPE